LNALQAQAYLDRFRTVGQEAIDSVIASRAGPSAQLDFSLSSLPEVMKWFLAQVRVNCVPFSDQVPEWIRNADPLGNIEFDESSKARSYERHTTSESP
jgi:hypothetical protein